MTLDTDHIPIARRAGIAQLIAAATIGSGVCVIEGEEGGAEVTHATRVATTIGIDVDYLSTAENDTLLRGPSTYIEHLASRRTPTLFIVTDAETDGHADLVEMVRAIRAGADATAAWAVAVITTRDHADVAVPLSRALDIAYRDIQHA